jgi:hypothetical protein
MFFLKLPDLRARAPFAIEFHCFLKEDFANLFVPTLKLKIGVQLRG